MKTIFSKISIMAAAMGAIALASCYDDDGNYDYHDLDEVVIDTAGIDGMQDSYSIMRYDTLTIEPKIYFNGALANDDSSYPLAYTWTIYSASTGVGVDYTVDTLSTTSVLDVPISREADTYYVLLTVLNTDDGTEQYCKWSLMVEESISAGWLLIYESADEPGTSDVGLVVNDYVKKNVIQEREYWDLYKSGNGAHISGLPVRVMEPAIALSVGDDPVFVQTDEDFCGLNNATFERILELEDMFYDAPEDLSLTYYGPRAVTGGGETVIVGNELYTSSFSSVTRNDYFGVAKVGDHGTLAPWANIMKTTSYFDAIVYDDTYKKFMCVNKSSIYYSEFASQDATCPFDVNDVGMDFVASDWGRSFYDYFIMDKDDSRYLLSANFYSSNSSSTTVGKGLYDISSATEIFDLTTMAMPYQGEFLVYGASNKVYCLRYAASDDSEVLWEADSEDEIVTCVRLQKYHYATIFLYGYIPNANQIMHIATWNETTNEGKLYQYPVNQASGIITGDPYIYTVPGKVSDMAWKYILEL